MKQNVKRSKQKDEKYIGIRDKTTANKLETNIKKEAEKINKVEEELETAEKFIAEKGLLHIRKIKKQMCKGGSKKAKNILCKICQKTTRNKFRSEHEEASCYKVEIHSIVLSYNH